MVVEKANPIESYKEDMVNRLLWLQQEHPWCWHKMAIHIDGPSGARALSEGSVIHWLEQRSVDTGLN